MKTIHIKLILILFFISHITSAQQSFCGNHPIPDRILTIQEEEYYLQRFNSRWHSDSLFTPRKTERWITDTLTRNNLKHLQRQIKFLSQDKSIDTSSNYYQ